MLLLKPAFLLLPLALTAIAAPLNAADVALAERNKSLFTVFSTTSHWARYARYGTSPLPKRALDTLPSSEPTKHLGPGQFASVCGGETAFHTGLSTADLRTAIGVAAVGTSAATGREERFLIHLPATRGPSEAWRGFVGAVKAARLRDMRVVVRVPDTARDVPVREERRGGGAPWDWSEADGRVAAMVRSEMQVLVRSNFGVAARVVASPMGAVYRGERGAGTMAVVSRDGGARVLVDGKEVA